MGKDNGYTSPNGGVSNETYPHGTRVKISCEEGYSSSNPNRTLIKCAKGRWKPELPDCIPSEYQQLYYIFLMSFYHHSQCPASPQQYLMVIFASTLVRTLEKAVQSQVQSSSFLVRQWHTTPLLTWSALPVITTQPVPFLRVPQHSSAPLVHGILSPQLLPAFHWPVACLQCRTVDT